MFGHFHHQRCGSRRGWSHGPGPFTFTWDDGGSRRRSRTRMFDGGELRLVLLRLIADEPRHGYELIRAIEALTKGGYVPSAGVVYPTLSLLDEMGFIKEDRSDDNRKRYSITATGTAHLDEKAEEVAGVMQRLTDMGEQRDPQGAAPIRRAMGNVRTALQNRMTQGGFSDDTLHDIAALLDEVAGKIERLR